MNFTGMNIVQLRGRLVRDPEIKDTQTGKKLMQFTLAYDTRSAVDTEGSHSNFIRVIAWEKTAELFFPLLKKGMEVLINGELLHKRWKNAEGENRDNFEISAKVITISDLKFQPLEKTA